MADGFGASERRILILFLKCVRFVIGHNLICFRSANPKIFFEWRRKIPSQGIVQLIAITGKTNFARVTQLASPPEIPRIPILLRPSCVVVVNEICMGVAQRLMSVPDGSTSVSSTRIMVCGVSKGVFVFQFRMYMFDLIRVASRPEIQGCHMGPNGDNCHNREGLVQASPCA